MITAVTPAGPAFFCAFLEALAAGGVACGLPEESAATLALQTMRGTAAYLQETAVTPAELIERVSSPGGTTVAGLTTLHEGNLQSLLQATIQSAAERSAELGGK